MRRTTRAVSSAVEHCLHTARVAGSIPAPPTRHEDGARFTDLAPFSLYGWVLHHCAQGALDRLQGRPILQANSGGGAGHGAGDLGTGVDGSGRGPAGAHPGHHPGAGRTGPGRLQPRSRWAVAAGRWREAAGHPGAGGGLRPGARLAGPERGQPGPGAGVLAAAGGHPGFRCAADGRAGRLRRQRLVAVRRRHHLALSPCGAGA